MSSRQFKKYRHGRSGPYSDEYHRLLGKSTWIVIKRLLRQEQSSLLFSHDAKGNEHQHNTELPQFSEGDICTVFSQFGEVADVRFVRHRKTGAFLGTAFVRYVDYRSAILAADCMNSNFDQNGLVTLEPSLPTATNSATAVTKSNLSGIIVERCEDAEVPQMYNSDVETFPEWQERCRSASLQNTLYRESRYIVNTIDK